MTEPKKMDLKSMGITEEKKEKLRQLFPEVFAEKKIDFEKLKFVLGEMIETGKERYGLNWTGKADCFKIIQQPSVGTLKPCREESVNFDTTENLFIEGDNLEVLKLLQKAYYGRVKMICIDPPYNTGNDFIYPDDYSESLDTYLKYTGQVDSEGRKYSTNTEADGRFHTKWINMMYPRLYLARNLLSDDGVIFIHIDDKEVANLRKICDEIFGEENLVANVVRRAKIGGGSDNKQFAQEADYILCYGKNISSLNEFFTPHTEEDLKRYKEKDEIGRFFWDTYSRSGLAKGTENDSLYFEVTFPDGSTRHDRWRRSQKRLEEDLKAGEAKYIKTTNGWNIHFKQRLSEEGKRPRQILFDGFGNTGGTDDIRNIFSNKYIFEYPKSVSLVTYLAEVSCASDSIILDFFAGSATTAHAVLDLNNHDNGNRKFIMVQLPEPCDEKSEAFKAGYKTISDIGKERIRRVIKKIKEEKGSKLEYDESKQDLGFKVFKLDKSNFKIWESENTEESKKLEEQLQLHVDHIDPKSKQEDILYELLLKAGFDLATKIEKFSIADKTVYSIADGAMLICLEEKLTKEVINAMAEMKPSRVICLDKGFKDNDQLKANAVQIMKSKKVNTFLTV